MLELIIVERERTIDLRNTSYISYLKDHRKSNLNYGDKSVS